MSQIACAYRYSHLLPHMQSDAALRVAALLGMGGCERDAIQTTGRKPPQSVRPEVQPFMNAEAS